MPRSMLFWMMYILCLVLWLWLSWPIGWSNGGAIVFFILIGLLGWGVYGKIVT